MTNPNAATVTRLANAFRHEMQRALPAAVLVSIDAVNKVNAMIEWQDKARKAVAAWNLRATA